MDAPSIEELRTRREVVALREALESAQFAHDQHHAHQASVHRSEIDELHAMIRSLRELVDSERAAHAQVVADLRRQLGMEIRTLQHALTEARAAFEAELLAMQGAHQGELLAAGRIRVELEATVKHLRERIDGAG